MNVVSTATNPEALGPKWLDEARSVLCTLIVLVLNLSQTVDSKASCDSDAFEVQTTGWPFPEPGNFGLDLKTAIVGSIQLEVTDAEIENEHREILKIDPTNNGLTWIMTKSRLAKWPTPLTKEILRHLFQYPQIQQALHESEEDGIHVVISAEKTEPGGSSHNNASTGWHTDEGTHLPKKRPIKQVLVLLYTNESNPTEMLLSSNEQKLFDDLKYTSRARANLILNAWPNLKTYRLQSGQVVLSAGNIFHRRTIATRSAWRYFLRFDFR